MCQPTSTPPNAFFNTTPCPRLPATLGLRRLHSCTAARVTLFHHRGCVVRLRIAVRRLQRGRRSGKPRPPFDILSRRLGNGDGYDSALGIAIGFESSRWVESTTFASMKTTGFPPHNRTRVHEHAQFFKEFSVRLKCRSVELVAQQPRLCDSFRAWLHRRGRLCHTRTSHSFSSQLKNYCVGRLAGVQNSPVAAVNFLRSGYCATSDSGAATFRRVSRDFISSAFTTAWPR